VPPMATRSDSKVALGVVRGLAARHAGGVRSGEVFDNRW